MKKTLVFLCACLFSSFGGAGNKWNGIVRKDVDDPQKWVELSTQLKEQHFYYGTVGAAKRILQYFSDLKSKQLAFQIMVEATDSGYPFSLAEEFISGDIETTALDSFSQSYNLYKATVNSRKNMPKWAENYFARIDKKNFSKFLFYKSLEAAKSNKISEAIQLLDDALARAKGPENAQLARKAARTLARLYYEKNLYQQAFDIYQTYLLKFNPLENSDWIEAAWCLYRLNRFEEAIGYLYNMELPIPDEAIYLEKYTIRSLVYRERCDSVSTEKLAVSFDREFGPTLEGIKMGKPLKNFSILKKIFLGATDYYRASRLLRELRFESSRIKELPPKLQAIAKFFYTSEINGVEKIMRSSEDESLDAAARNLVVLNESLKFLAFDVAREKFNPDKVFTESPPEMTSLVTDATATTFNIHWLQWGDYWRDERSLYRGILKNRCQ